MIAFVSTVIDAPIADVGPLLADFASWHTWLPPIQSTVMVGTVRLEPITAAAGVALLG